MTQTNIVTKEILYILQLIFFWLIGNQGSWNLNFRLYFTWETDHLKYKQALKTSQLKASYAHSEQLRFIVYLGSYHYAFQTDNLMRSKQY
jgi:hypothetical protein